MTRQRAGFTLIEVAVVLFILVVAFSILLPRLPRTADSRNREALRRLAASVQALHEEATFKKKAWL